MLTLVAPAGTVKVYTEDMPEVPDKPVTATPFVSVLPPPPEEVTVTDFVVEFVAVVLTLSATVSVTL